jgi:hypothetical protein
LLSFYIRNIAKYWFYFGGKRRKLQMKAMHMSYTLDGSVRDNESSKMRWAYEVAGMDNCKIYNKIVSKFLQKNINESSSYNNTRPPPRRGGGGEVKMELYPFFNLGASWGCVVNA